MKEIFVLATETGVSRGKASTTLSISTQKGFFVSFEDAKSQAVGEEFPFAIYRGYGLQPNKPQQTKQKRKV